MELGIYVHIPFCKSKCYYCDFLSYSSKEDNYKAYIDALINEMEAHRIKADKDLAITTIFIGGGTPSVLPPILLEKLLVSINENFNIGDKAEYTIEANPGTLTDEKLKIMKKYGVNRISIGGQTYDEGLLKTIGRCHQGQDITNSFLLARRYGFNNINLDLMFALPGQSLDQLKETLDKVVKLSPEHISAYSLIVEEGTPFGELEEKGQLSLPSEDEERAMYYLIEDYLKENGYSKYEVSNFSKEGKFSRHNINNWKTCEYIGLGLAAHSYYKGYRYSNTCNMDQYIENSRNLQDIQEDRQHVGLKAQMEEFMFLGLRLTEGIDIREFEKRFKKSIYSIYGAQIKNHLKNNLLAKGNGRIWLTDYGQDVSNMVLCSFLLD